MVDDLYYKREQTYAKHLILESYLERLAVKIGMLNVDVVFVDGFSGPWDERDPDFKDTSFAVALRCLESARKTVTEAGRKARFHCLFNERNGKAYAKLSSHLRSARDQYPHLIIRDFHGSWEENVSVITSHIPQHAFRLVFIDPCGWKGFPPSSLRSVCDGHSEVLVNFMHEHIRRFLGGRHEKWYEWLIELLGDRVRYDDAVPKDFDIEWIKAEYRNMLRNELGKQYVAQADVFATSSDRVHFSLIFGTGSPVGLDEFRKAERSSLSQHDRNRQVSDFVEGTVSLFGGDAPTGPYEGKVESLLHDLPRLFLSEARQARATLSYRDIKVRLQEAHPFLDREIKDAFVALARDGLVEPTWKRRSGRAHRPNEKDLVILRERN